MQAMLLFVDYDYRLSLNTVTHFVGRITQSTNYLLIRFFQTKPLLNNYLLFGL